MTTDHTRLGTPVGVQRRWLFVMAIEAMLVLALLLLGRQDPQTLGVRLFQFVALSTTGLIGWGWALIRRPEVDSRLVVAIVALLAGAALSAAVSPYGTVAWSSVWHAMCVTGTALLFGQQASDAIGRRNLLALVTILFVVVVAAYFVVVASLWREWLALGLPLDGLPLRPGNVGGVLPIPTWFGDAVVVIGPMAVYAVWRTGGVGRPVAGAMVGLAAIAIFITATRSIWLLIPIGGVVLLTGSGIRHAARVAMIGVVAAAIGVVAIGLTGAGSTILRDIDAGRSSAFASAIQLASERPILGGGSGTYGIWRLDDDVAFLAHRAFPNAHNLVLNTLAETGIIGLVLWAIAVALIAWILVDRWRDGTNERLAVVAAIAGLTMIFGHAMVDVVIEQRGLLMLVLIVAGIGMGSPDGPPSIRRWRLARRPTIAIAAVLVLAFIPAVRAEVAMWSLGARPADAAAIASDVAPVQVGLAAAADETGDAVTARTATETAVRIEGTAAHRISLAWLARSEGDVAASVRLATDALAQDQLDPFVLLNGLTLLDDGTHDDARVDALTAIYVAESAFSVDGLAPDIRALASEARSAAADRLLADGRPYPALVVALTADDRDLAARIVGAADAELEDDLTLVVDAWFGGAAERSALYTATTAAPNADTIWASWYVAANACESAEAQRWRRANVILTGQPPIIPGEPHPATSPPLWPTGYPEQVWRIALPEGPYVAGTWTYPRLSPDCLSAGG